MRSLPTPTPVLLLKQLAIWLHYSYPALFFIILQRLHQSMKRLVPCHAQAAPYPPEVLSSPSTTCSHSWFLAHFKATRTPPPPPSLFLQLKPFDIERKAACFTPCALLFQKHKASHMAGAGELPGGQNSNVSGQQVTVSSIV